MQQHNFDEHIDRKNTHSKKWDRYPEDVLPMWVADTDFRSPQPIIDALKKRVEHGIFGYTWEHGSLERSTASWLHRRFAWDIDPASVDFTPSVVVALALAVQAFTAPGDNVLIQTPVYPPFIAVPTANRRVPVMNSLVWRDGAYHIDFADLEAKLALPRTKLMLLCNPHNPTGRCFTREELLRIGELCLKHNVYVLSDEIHSDFIYRGQHIPFATLSPELARISLVTINPSKTFNIADLRTSAVITPDKETQRLFKEAVASSAFGRCSLGVLAYDVAYTQCDYYADQVKAYMKKNTEYAVDYFTRHIPAITAYAPEATFLLWLNCKQLGFKQPDLVSFFVEKAKVAFNSGTDFGPEGEGYMRMNLGCTMATLKDALDRIKRAVGTTHA